MITVDFQNLVFSDNDIILDIGCGTGRHTAAAYDLCKGFVVGADPDVKDLKTARTKLYCHEKFTPSQKRRWSLAGADITHLPFDDQSVDLVICSEVLEHIANHKRAIAECVRVLKPGKHMVVSVPRRWPESICWCLSPRYRNSKGGHIRIYRKGNLIKMIQSINMVHWKTHYAHSLHTPFWWLKCLLGLQRNQLWPVTFYHRFLTWDLMKKPRVTRILEKVLDPVMGKSVVLYFQKLNPLQHP